jgi:hypothetical protein
VTGRALHADRDARSRVAPAADLVRAVHAAPRRVVREHQRDLGPSGEDLRLQVPQRGQGERLGVVRDAAVVGQLERLEDVDRVLAGRHEHGGVLGAGDVPLQALVDQHVALGPADALDVRRDLVDRELLVRDAAVVGDDDPVEAELVRLRDLLRDRVLAVVGVLGVDVVVARVPALTAAPGVDRDVRLGLARADGPGDTGGTGRDAQAGEEPAALDRRRAVVPGVEPAALDGLYLVVVVRVITVLVIVGVGHAQITTGQPVQANERRMNPCTGNFIHTAWTASNARSSWSSRSSHLSTTFSQCRAISSAGMPLHSLSSARSRCSPNSSVRSVCARASVNPSL